MMLILTSPSSIACSIFLDISVGFTAADEKLIRVLKYKDFSPKFHLTKKEVCFCRFQIDYYWRGKKMLNFC
jgi:hypothetical protein